MRPLHFLMILLAVLAVLGRPAWADDFAARTRALNADSFSDKIAAAQALAASGDPRALPVLSAMRNEGLYVAADGALLIDRGNSVYSDAVSGKTVPVADPSDLQPVAVNNRLRGVLGDLLASLQLSDPDPSVRLKAVQTLGDNPSGQSEETLRSMLPGEKDAAVRSAINSILAAIDLSSSDTSRRLSAVAALAGSSDPEVEAKLTDLVRGETDADVKAKAKAALSEVHVRRMVIDACANLFQGVSLGSVLLLAAIGLAITFGVMGVINMAHGEMIMLGAYVTYVVQEAFRAWLPPSWLDFYLIAACPAAFLFTGMVGIVLERGLIRFLYGRPLETLLSTYGISLILQQAVRTVFGAPNKDVANPAWLTGGVELMGGFTLTWNRLAIVLFALVVFAALAAALRWSSFGLSMRAVAQNRPMAAAMGIRTNRIDALTFGLGSGIAGVAGMALTQVGNVSPNLGQAYIVDSFMVVVFGGVGSLWGTVMGALSLGVVNKVLEPYAGAMLGKILVLVFIILFIQKRPRGLFAQKGRSAEG